MLRQRRKMTWKNTQNEMEAPSKKQNVKFTPKRLAFYTKMDLFGANRELKDILASLNHGKI